MAVVNDLLNSLMSSSGFPAGKGLSASDINSISVNAGTLSSFIAGNNAGTGNPKAFLEWVLFDERFKFISGDIDPVNTTIIHPAKWLKRSILISVLKACCYLPYLYFIIFYLYVVRAILEFGQLPGYDNPDPKKLGFGTHRLLVYWTSNLPLLSILVIFLFKLFLPNNEFSKVQKIHYILFLFGFVMMIIHFAFDPLSEWFLD
jgi:hypothetical protein